MADSIGQQCPGESLNRNYNSNGSQASNPGPRLASLPAVATASLTTKLTPIQLDVKNTDSTETFTCIKKDGFAKYTAKDGYGFSSIKKTGGLLSSSVEEVWNTNDPNDYATTVVRDGTGMSSSMSNVTIFFDKKFKHLTKSDSAYFIDSGIRLFVNDASDPSKTKQLPGEQYKGSCDKDVFKFELKNDTKCTEVKYIHRCLESGNSSKVVLNLEPVWKHDSKKHGDQYPKVIKYYWPDKMLIDFEHISIIHTKNTEGKWDNGLLFEIKMYTNDSNNAFEELEITSFDIKEQGYEHIVTFKKDIKCVQIKHKGVELWKHETDKHGDKYPTSLSYIKNGSMLYINFDTFFIVCKKNENKTWNSNEFFIKFYTIDPNDETEHVELTTTSFVIEQDDDGFDFKMNDGVKCMLIKSDSKILWKHGPGTDTEEHPSVIRYSDSRVLVNLSDTLILCEKDTRNNWRKFHFPFKLYKRDPKSYTKILELNGSDYKLVHQGENFKFVFKSNVNLLMVEMDGKELWKHDGYIAPGPHPTSVIYSKNKRKFSMDYENFFTLYKKETDGSWGKGQIIDMKLYIQDPKDASKILTLSDNHYHLKDEVEEFEFELKPTVKCTMVKLSGDKVWSYDRILSPGKYPKRIVYKRHKTMVSLVFEGFYVLIQKEKSSELWVPRESTTLDIALTVPTPEYTYQVHQLFSTYVPEEQFLFDKVKIGDNVIYDPINPCDLATKVLVYKTTTAIDVVDLYLPDGIIKRYGRRQDDSWYEKLTSLSLDLKMEANGYSFKCLGRDMGSYYTRKGFGFGKVVFGSWDIWEAQDEIDYASKVDVNEMEDNFEVHVYLKSGVKKEFTVQKIQRQKLLDISTPSHSGSVSSSQHVSLF
ncbi:hypothetical protein MACJ_001245 [Theileria orientalis]|uniref:Uncharacterized protein n=1 Tax=Theileria orientalis TaxID=68886 RepID=A0A976M887_THEOR|nr:hypothetical protein MACJ_001245 [Theileria orientalis]